MPFADAVRIGPLALPIRYLVIIGSALIGIAVVWLLFRRRRRVRRTTLDILSTGVLVFFAVWKLSPLLSQGAAALREPLLLLYAPGGPVGTVLGLVAVAGYGVVLWFRRRRDLVHTSPALVVFAATAAFAWLAGTAAVDLARAAGAENADGAFPEASEGFAAPAFSLPETSGAMVSLASLRGKPVLLTFWATWCGPCRAELPAKMRFHEDWGDRVHVVGVNMTHTEAGPEVVSRYVAQAGIEYLVLLDRRGRVSGLYNLFGTPTTVLIDADGTIVERRFGAVTYEWLATQARALVEGA